MESPVNVSPRRLPRGEMGMLHPLPDFMLLSRQMAQYYPPGSLSVSRPIPARRIRDRLLFAAALLAASATMAGACGRDTDCMIGQRSYRIALPQDHDGTTPIGAIVFAHGFRGTASGVMRNKALTALADKLGVAFIAAQADGPEWIIPGIPSKDHRDGVDELAYFDALVEDAAERFAIDRTRIMASGFSSGAMMVWHLACHRGAAFAGFAPMSGTFWAPVPQSCPSGPVNLIHTHGDADPVVPLKGRPIGDAHQGDGKQAIGMMVRLGGYQPVKMEQTAGLDCAMWLSGDGKALQFCLFSGGHKMKARHISRAWRSFMSRDGG
jgi:polyhydroxybutyrate depolymerase